MVPATFARTSAYGSSEVSFENAAAKATLAGTLIAARAIARDRRDEVGCITAELRGHRQQLKVSQTYAWRYRGEAFLRRRR